MSVSAVLIVKNEEARLQACLDSLLWADEIIVLDSGSEDKTVDIAKKYTNKVYLSEHWNGFGRQRQLAQSYATGDWIFAVDADEVVTPQLANEIQACSQKNQLGIVYAVNRYNWAFGKFINYSGWNPDWIVRLYPRLATSYCDSLVHESVISDEFDVVRIEGRLLHYTYDSLYDYNKKVAGYLQSWADQREGVKKSSVMKGLCHGFFAFLRMYFLRRGFLDGRHGFILAFLTAYTTSQKYFDLWLRESHKKVEERNVNL